MALTPPSDRRFEPRTARNGRGVVVAPGVELACLIADISAAGMKLRLDRRVALPPAVQVVDVATGLAHEAEVVWNKGQEAGLTLRGQSSLRGLVPARLTPAREAWLRAGGRQA